MKRKLKCKWTREMADDIRAYGIDAEKVLAKLLEGEIESEVAKERKKNLLNKIEEIESRIKNKR